MNHKLGYRFKPNDEQLINHYLKRKVLGFHSEVDQSIAEVDFLKSEPWDLPAFSKEKSKDPFWYFIYQLDYKYLNSTRANRKTEAGLWKATGKDREVWRTKKGTKVEAIGIKKTLVFYKGGVSKNSRTNWVMHEYRITTNLPNPKAYVICRLEKKPDGKARTSTPDEAEPSHQSSCQTLSDFGNHVAFPHDEVESSHHSSHQSPSYFGIHVAEVDPPSQADLRAITECDELDDELYSELPPLLNTEHGLSLQDLPLSNSDCNRVQTPNSFSSSLTEVQTQFGPAEPPSSNSLSSDCNGFQIQFGTTQLVEDFAFSDSLLANECDAYPEETSSHKNSVVESEGLNLNWDFDGMSIAHLLESFTGTSYNGGMIGDTNDEVAIAQAREAVEHVIAADLRPNWNTFPDTSQLSHNSNPLTVLQQTNPIY